MYYHFLVLFAKFEESFCSVALQLELFKCMSNAYQQNGYSGIKLLSSIFSSPEPKAHKVSL